MGGLRPPGLNSTLSQQKIFSREIKKHMKIGNQGEIGIN
jgi:hypothetical protein